MVENDIVRILTSENEEFKKLGEEHRSLEEKLSELTGRVYLTPEERMKKKEIKKLKLFKKDRMAEIIRKYKESYSN